MRTLLPTFFLAFAPSFAAAAEPKVDFARDVLPILSDNCFKCHGPDEMARKADLRLDLKDEARKSLVPGNSATSELIRRLKPEEVEDLMPPAKSNKKLTPQQIATLTKWVDQGAAWGTHWAFTPIKRPPLPAGAKGNPIDAFVGDRLMREKLSFAPEADRERLLRRLALDLTGLPPTPTEVDAFLADKTEVAYETVVDRLLASPRFGERMAWDWLDASRYADSNGYQGDGERTMWPWRDWVVKSFNENMAYDRFTVQQLAGDLLPNASREQILATGFNRNHMINGEGGRIAEENRIEYVFDQTEAVGTIWLGLTLTCSRCHDHKFDPLTRTDYYRLFAYFNQTPVNGGGGSGQTAPVIDFGTPEMEAKQKAAQKEYDAAAKAIAPIETKLREAGMIVKDGKYDTTLPVVIESALRKGFGGRVDPNNDDLIKHYAKSEPEYVKKLAELRKLKSALDAAAKVIPRVMVMQDLPKPRETFILTRGTYDKHEGKVEPGIPAVFGGTRGANRLQLANWIVAPENPLTARVTVNRFWQMFFGTGLVKTTEDFGIQGERPSHPELLDWLAADFVSSKWDVKRLVKQIVMSRTYRQASKVSAELRERDPENRLLARGPRYRLPSWMIRDQALAASGLLTPTFGGPSVNVYQPAGVWEEATFGFKRYQQDKGEALYRRSLYVFWRRIVGPTIFFDSANRQTCTVKTVVTNTPLHALGTLNDTTYVEAARVLAERSIKEGGRTESMRLAFAFRRVLGRNPTEIEAEILYTALAKQRKLFAADEAAAKKLLAVGDSKRDEKLSSTEHAALTAVCTMILNLDETLTKQ